MANPYAAPEAAVSDATLEGDEAYEPKILSTQGRIGRLRYIAYSSFLTMALAFFIGIAAAIVIPMVAKNMGSGKGLGPAMSFLFILYAPIIAITFIMAKRRLNDLEHSGWLSLLLLVPLVNFFMWLYLIIFSRLRRLKPIRTQASQELGACDNFRRHSPALVYCGDDIRGIYGHVCVQGLPDASQGGTSCTRAHQ